jgi:Starch-binding associating with outer membrane
MNYLMKIYRIILSLIFASVIFYSCTGDFKEMNINPNNPVDVPAINIFTNAIISSVHLELFDLLQVLWCQQWCKVQYTSSDGYSPRDFSTFFDRAYKDGLKNFTLVINKSSEGNNQLLAAAKIMRAWSFMYLTDLFGDVPYTEALQGFRNDGLINPKYDSVESIYSDLLAELEEANILLSGTAINFGSGDILYNGDPVKWRKFANSLKLRLLNRCAGTPWTFTYGMTAPQDSVTTTPGSSALTKVDDQIMVILANPEKYPIFGSNDDNAKLVYPGSQYKNPIFAALDLQPEFGVSETLVDWLKARNDPRLHIYAQPTPNSVAALSLDYSGFQNGRNITSAYYPSISLLGTQIVHNETAPLYVLCFDEVEFINAEYYLRAGNNAAARSAYEAGIAACMERWGLVDGGTVFPSWGNSYNRIIGTTPYSVNYATYLDHSLVVWGGTDSHKFQLICEQKWAAMFGQGIQAYSEVRRTGFPKRIFEYELEGTYYPELGLPVRLTYPTSEEALNTYMLIAAKKAQNIEESNHGMFSTNGTKSQIWWNTRKNPIPRETDVR